MKTKLISRKLIPKGEDGLISPNLTTQQKFNILKQTYHYKDNKPLFNPTDKIDDYREEFINDMFDNFVLNQNPIGVNYDYLPYNDIEVIGYAPLFLETYYPMIHPWYGKNEYPDSYKGRKINQNYNPDKDFKWTGHSAISQRNGQIYTKTMEDSDYNLLLNNCSDETRRILETIFNKQLKTFGFTTPGDVRDFALENGGKSIEDVFDHNKKYGRYIMIPMNKERYERLRKYNKGKNEQNK